MSRRLLPVAIVILTVIGLVAAPGAATDAPVTGSGPFTANNGPSVTLNTEGGTSLNFSQLFPDNNTVHINATGGVATFTSAGPTNVSVTESDLEGQWTNVTALNVTEYNLTVDAADKPAFTVGKQADNLSVSKTISADDGQVDFRYAGASGESLVSVTGVQAGVPVAAVDADTGAVLDGDTADATGRVTFANLSNSGHDVVLQTGIGGPQFATSTATPQGNVTVRDGSQNLQINLSDADLPSDNISVGFYVDGSLAGSDSLTSNGTASYTTTALSDGTHTWRAEATDAFGETATSDTFAFTVDHYDPFLSEPQPQGLQQQQSPSQLSINVTDRDFATVGDSLSVDFYLDGVAVGSDTLASNGTATTTISGVSGGSHTARVEVTDSYGQTDTREWTFSTPANLTIYRENQPGTKLDTVTVDVSFVGDDEIFTRSTSTGQVNMTGLPVNQPFVVTASAQNNEFEDRRIYIGSIYQQQEIYLLNTSAVAAYPISFNVEDQTSEFSPNALTFEISRPLTKDFNSDGNETTQFQVISGDQLDASGSYPATLEGDVRYRIQVTNNDGDVRELGTVVPRAARTYNLVIKGIDVNASENADGWVLEASANRTNTTNGVRKTLRVEFDDGSAETTRIAFTVHPAGNASAVIDSTIVRNESGIPSYAYTNVVRGEYANQSLVVNYTITRNGQNISGTDRFGINEYPIADGLSQDWGAIFGVGFLVVLAGLFSVANARIGALIVPGAAMVLYVTGIISPVASAAAIGLAFAIAVVINVVETSGVMINQ